MLMVDLYLPAVWATSTTISQLSASIYLQLEQLETTVSLCGYYLEEGCLETFKNE
jgi:hypothetical protein